MQAAWRAADLFVSLSDNVQETFGLTPVEAMGVPMVRGSAPAVAQGTSRMDSRLSRE